MGSRKGVGAGPGGLDVGRNVAALAAAGGPEVFSEDLRGPAVDIVHMGGAAVAVFAGGCEGLHGIGGGDMFPGCVGDVGSARKSAVDGFDFDLAFSRTKRS